VSLTATNSEPGSLTVRVRDSGGTLIRKYVVANGSGPTAVTWDGRDASGTVVPDGDYVLRISPSDPFGNTGAAVERTVAVVSALRSVASSAAIFYPQDLDTLARTTTLSFVLLRPMTVTWTLRDATGAIVDTHLDAVARPAGTTKWVFDGRRTDGTMLPAGHYTSYVSASDGTLTASQAVSFEADAFLQRLTDATPRRGQTVTIYVTSAEPLSSTPRVYVYEPGLSSWSVALTKTGTYTYRATLAMKSGGTSGTVKIKVLGKDSGGRTQRTIRAYALG